MEKTNTNNDKSAGTSTAARIGVSGTGKTLAAEVIATDLGVASQEARNGNGIAIETIVLQNEGFEASGKTADAAVDKLKR